MPDSYAPQMDVMAIFHDICDFGGRLSGTQSETDALDYVQNTLSSLSAGQLITHNVTYPGWTSSDCRIEIGDGQLGAFALPRSGSLPMGGASLQVVDAGRGTPEELEALGSALAGKAVVVTHEFMFSADHVHRMKKYECAQSLGAAAFVIANSDPATGKVSGGVGGTLPGFGVSAATRSVLKAAAQTGEPIQFHLDSSHIQRQTRTIDWSIPGTDPAYSGEEIIVCAHLDGHESSENAMDNASGVAVTLALASELNALGDIPCTVRILIFSAEEFGLCASQSYVANLSPERRAGIRAVFNLDCVGGSSRFGAMTSGFSGLRAIVEQAARAAGASVAIHDPLLRNSDHYNFAVAGIPAMRLIAGFEDQGSRLRQVLTEADTRDRVTQDELEISFRLTRALVDAACGNTEVGHFTGGGPSGP